MKLKNKIFYIGKAICSYFTYFFRKAKLTKQSRIDHELICLHYESIKDFKNALYQFSCQGYTKNKVAVFLDAYANKAVKPVKMSQIATEENTPILLCVVKDDLERVKLQVKHHRKIGIKHFAYIDNISKDGTFEWLNEQKDISLFTVNENFNAIVKNAWRRQLVDILGYNRWYLVLDSDELFVYPGLEKKNLEEYICFLENNNITNVLSPMIDMYSKDKLFQEGTDIKEISAKYCYFDIDTYYKTNEFARQLIIGGPRTRLFFNEKHNATWLTKYSLIKFSKEMLMGTHMNLPYKHNFQTNGAIAFLLHYKFLPHDNKKFREIITYGAYANRGREYKQYMEMFEQNPNISFYYEKSEKLNSSMDLLKIKNIIDRKFLNVFLNK